MSSRRDAAAPGLTGSTKTAQSSRPHAGPSVFRGRGEEGHTHSRGGVPWQLGGERACGRPGDPSPVSGASGSSRPGPALCVCLVTQLQMRAVSTEKGSLDGDASRCSFWGGAGVRCRTLPPLALPQTLGAGVFRRTPQAPGRARGAQGRPGGGGGRLWPPPRPQPLSFWLTGFICLTSRVRVCFGETFAAQTCGR